MSTYLGAGLRSLCSRCSNKILKDAKNKCNNPLRAVPWLGSAPQFPALRLQHSNVLGICIIIVNISCNLV